MGQANNLPLYFDMKRWEYRKLICVDIDQKALNKLGQDGWELIEVSKEWGTGCNPMISPAENGMIRNPNNEDEWIYPPEEENDVAN